MSQIGRSGSVKVVVSAKKVRALEVLGRLSTLYPSVACALHFESVFQLLVATILSAQCTDVRVNKVTPGLFRRLPSVVDFAESTIEVIQHEIRSINFFRNKARHIYAAARMIVDEFGGEVPRTMPEMLRLPGVARKTANVVLSVGYGILDGIVVDTHVRRLATLLGLTREDDPVKIERELLPLIPKSERDHLSLLLIQHGREVCIARRPRCESCVLSTICPSSKSRKPEGKNSSTNRQKVR